MARQHSRLALAALAACLGIVAPVAAGGSASAATTRPATATAPTATSGDLPASGSRQGPSTSAAAGTVRFTPIARPGHFAPATAYGCTVSYPYVNDNFSNGEISWSATVSCNIVLRMQGTTALFQWGSSSAYAFGSSYDNYSSSNTSTGAVYGIFSGTWGVNDNVLLFSPAGYTSTPGAGCYYYNPPANTEIKCTETTGPFTAQ